jgi:NAD(P)-dependent dehydrogenase (short-subunit alcohol dehydrogenase family)
MTDKRIAVVTGGNRGIGFEVCRQLGDAGWHVVLCARDASAGAEAVKELEETDLSVELRRVDVARGEHARSLGQYLFDTFGRVDLLVNNAGIMIETSREHGRYSADVLEVSPQTLMEIFNVNTLGAVRISQALAPLMGEGARIVNVSSGMGALNDMDGGWAGYRMSKTALNALTRIFHDRLSDRGILVNSVCPGWVSTGLGGPKAPVSPEEAASNIVWLGTSEEVTTGGGFYRDRVPIDW